MAHACRVARSLSLPSPFTVRAFVAEVQEARGRRIVLHAVEPGWGGTSGWCGAWLEEPDADHIVFVRDPLSTLRNALTVVHEVGHILLNHPGTPLPAQVDLATMGLAGATRARGRAAFDDPEERAAETFSSIVLQAAMAQGAVDVESDTQLARLKSRLG